MVSGMQLPHGDPWLQRQNEPSIAVSTRNPLHLLAGANDYRTVDIPGKPEDELPGQEEKKAQAPREPWLGIFKSFDGGQSWITSLLPGFPQDNPDKNPELWGNYNAAADPVVRAGTNGLFYYSGIAFNRTEPKDSAVFVARFIDNNNKEKNYEKDDCIKYFGTKIIAKALPGEFIDKPWIAVDLPRGKGQTVTIDGQRIPKANVYLAYSVFTGEKDKLKSKIYFAQSTDCGENWSVPIEISGDNCAYQSATIAVDPRANGHVYVAWRRFCEKSSPRRFGKTNQYDDAIFIARSVNSGMKFHKVIKIASFYPFDQPSSTATFRTNSYPTLTIDHEGRIYLAWSQRIGGADGDARIVLSTSSDGIEWSSPKPIKEAGAQGHQIMPSLTFAAGKLTMVWYDQRNDISQRFDKYIDDQSEKTRHTLDVRVAQAYPGLNPYFEPSKQVSRYLFTLADPDVNGKYSVNQIQFNCVNYPLFQIGTWPFIGDYIDITPAPMFVLDESGHWRYNTQPSDSTVFHAVWTDNRDVRPPLDRNWQAYSPPRSYQSDPDFYTDRFCSDWTKTGMRNQNIYASCISRGIVTRSPGNTKPLGTLGETPEGENIPRAFVVIVKNTTDEIKSFRLTIANQPLNGSASFLEFEFLDWLDVEIVPRSSITRTVFVYSSDSKASVKVNIIEIDVPYGEIIPGGLESFVVLNPDIQNPDIQNPDIQNPDIQNPDIMNFEVHNPDIMNWYINPDIMNPDIQNPDIMNPDIQNPDIMNYMNPDIMNPDIQNPDIMNPDIQNPDIMNPDIMNPDIMNPTIPDPHAGEFIDVIWEIQNIGNTTSSYIFKTLSAAADEEGRLPLGIQAQLLIYRVYATPDEYNSPISCELGKQEHHELILNIINPDIMNPDIQNVDLENPDIQNPDIQNATFSLEPEGVAKVVLRLWKPYNYPQLTVKALSALNTDQAIDEAEPWDLNSILNSLNGFASGTSRNTTDLQAGIPIYPSDSSLFMITTKILDSGEKNKPYSDFLRASGGTKPYTWGIISGSLPSALNLNSATGEIYGTPTTAGTFSFTTQVTDKNSKTCTKDVWITIFPASGGYTISGRVTIYDKGLEGVMMSGLPDSPVTDSSGYYLGSVPPNWSGTVTPTKPGYVFSPISTTYEPVSGNQITNYTLISAPPTQVELSGPPSVEAAKVSGAFTLTSKDIFGNFANVIGNTVFNISSTGTATFYSDSGGTSPITQVTIFAGTSSAIFYYKNNPIGDQMVTATFNSGPANLGSDTHTITVTLGAPTQIRVETAYDGTGTVVPAQNITAGSSITVYAIARDAGGNFIENVAADSWSLINRTGDVVDGDLAPAVDKKSAVFAGHSAGTAQIHAAKGVLSSTDSAILTVTEGALDHFDFDTIGTQTIDTQFPITITAKDANENVVATYAGTNDLNLNIGTMDPTSTTAFTNGVWTGNVTITTAQYGTKITTNGGGKTGQSNAFDVLYPGPYSTISGLITYNGSPFLTTANVELSLNDVVANQQYPIPQSCYNPKDGTFSIPNVWSGKYLIYVKTDNDTPPNYLPYPGDYWGGSAIFDVVAPTPVTQNFAVLRIIHLTSPADNNPPGILRTPPYPMYASPITFRWEGIPEAETYEIWVQKWQDDTYQNLGIVFQETGITETQKTLSLLANAPNEHYAFRVFAYNSSNERVGDFIVTLTRPDGGIYGFGSD
jgi:hypothetical protein